MSGSASSKPSSEQPVPEVVAEAQRQMSKDGTVPKAYVEYVMGGPSTLAEAERMTVRVTAKAVLK